MYGASAPKQGKRTGVPYIKLDIQPLLTGEKDYIAFSAELGLSGLCGDIKNGLAKISGFAASHGGYLELKADTDINAVAVCARCGEEFGWRYAFSTLRPVAAELEDRDSDEYILAENAYIDIKTVFEGEVLLEMPVKLLCGEDCRGLCCKCGANLNGQGCFCPEKEPDPRFEALRSLLENN